MTEKEIDRLVDAMFSDIVKDLNLRSRTQAYRQTFSVDVPSFRDHYIKKVIFNKPAVIIMWADKTKTIVKCQKGDNWDPEKGLAIAILKKIFGNTGAYNTIFAKWLEQGETVKDEL